MVAEAAADVSWRVPMLGWDMTRLAWVAAFAGLLLLLALGSIWRARGHSRRAKILWTVLAVALPIIGPLAWAIAGREPRRMRADR